MFKTQNVIPFHPSMDDDNFQSIVLDTVVKYNPRTNHKPSKHCMNFIIFPLKDPTTIA
jgi:hypothetical protein